MDHISIGFWDESFHRLRLTQINMYFGLYTSSHWCMQQVACILPRGKKNSEPMKLLLNRYAGQSRNCYGAPYYLSAIQYRPQIYNNK